MSIWKRMVAITYNVSGLKEVGGINAQNLI